LKNDRESLADDEALLENYEDLLASVEAAQAAYNAK